MDIGDKKHNTLFIDSGAAISLFKIGKFNSKQQPYNNNTIKLIGITNNSVNTIGTVNSTIYFHNASIQHQFHLVPDTVDIETDGILGRDFLTQYECIVDYKYHQLKFSIDNTVISLPIESFTQQNIIIPARSEIIHKITIENVTNDCLVQAQEIQPGIFCGNTIISKDSPYIKILNTTESNVPISKTFNPSIEPLDNYYIFKSSKGNKHDKTRIQSILNKINSTNTPNYVQEQLKNLISEYSDIFCINEDHITTNNFYKQTINLKDNIPTYIPNYKQIHSQTDEINDQIDKMLENDIIEQSTSPYNSPILLVPKKSDNNKKWRLVVDFRQLNKKIFPDKFPLPRIDTILDQLGKAKYFSTLDLMSGFHQIPLEDESRKYTAFSTTKGHYQFKRLPFGLNISPNSFQRMMAIAMAGLTPEISFVYIDDIIVTGYSINNHFNNLVQVFDRLRHYNLKLNPEKCRFFKSEVTYLGHKITDQGILPDESKYETIKKFPIPNNTDEVRRFVAFCNYYRKFINNFANIARPLNNLLKKDINFEWNDNCQQAFNALKTHLLSPTILKYPDFTKQFIVTTDASDIACGAILSQDYEGKDLPIEYASKTFTKGEKSKSIIEKELTAIHWAINHFKPYLYGRKFVIKTDHRPLVYLFGMKNPTSKLTRMRLDLEEFNFEIQYVAGKSNVVADALSRIITNSDDLKTLIPTVKDSDFKEYKDNAILKVNTRAMTQAKVKDKQIEEKSESRSKLTKPVVWITERPSDVKKMLKVKTEVKEKEILFQIWNHNYNKLLGKIVVPLDVDSFENGSQKFEFALLETCQIARKFNRDKLAISFEEDLFKYFKYETIKEIADKAIFGFEIIVFNQPKWIENEQEINNIIKEYHENCTGGHIGQYRLYLKLREKFKWKNMKEYIKNYVKACKICKMNKVTKHTKENMIITSTPSKPFAVISIDTVGPLPKTVNNNKFAITIQCDLTKYVVIIPIQNKEADTIARVLVEDFILTYGKFLELKSDQGTEYNNEVLKQISKILKIKQTFATAYHPETIGSLERNHRSLNEYLRIFTNEHHDDWDSWIKFYQFVYNTTPHTETNYTPYELVFGRTANLPQEIYKQKIDPIYNIEEYYNELKYKLQKSNELARKKIIEGKENKHITLNQNKNPIDISIGDLIYLKNENRKKLDPEYIGPFIVVKLDNPNCVIRNRKTNKQSTVHMNRLIRA